MKLIDKHLFRELLAPLFYCLAGFGMVLVIGEMFGDVNRIMEARPGVLLVVRFYLSLLGPMLQFLVPASLMLATLFTLYTLTRNNELVAMRASGISIYRLMMPFVIVGIALSIGMTILGEVWVPHAYEWAEEIKSSRFVVSGTNTIQRCVYLNPEARRQWIIEELDPKHPGVLTNVEIKQESDDGRRLYVITANRAEHLDGQWWLTNPHIQRFGDRDNPIGVPSPIGTSTNSVVEMREFDEIPEAFVSAVRKWDYLNLREMQHYIKTHPGMSERSRHEKLFSLHSRLAMPWACLIVVFFAIPAGARTGRQGALSAIFTAIALMAGFYTVAQLGLVLGSTGTIAPWFGAWLSNIIFGIVGLELLRRLR
jgi:lipopolysaccharide export system permease protein